MLLESQGCAVEPLAAQEVHDLPLLLAAHARTDGQAGGEGV